MGALMRALDWSRTPVGPVETWPQSLRTVLSILLTSRHPIFIWWGQELVQFYNDAYRPILGATKHPSLGQRGRECWTEIWDVIGPMIQSVMERGESTFIQDGLLCLDRNGYLEEAYFTYAYSPIEDESGGTGGVFVACTESTERILGERRLQMLRELSAAPSELESAKEVCRKASGVLATNPHDIPFALLYLTDARGQTMRLVGTVGLEPGSAAAPPTLEAGDARAPWPRARGEALLMESLPPSLGPLPGGPWPEAASSALVLPLSAPGQDTPAGLLVAGISPRKALDAKYRGFLELAATHIANAITNARAYEHERQRAEALDRAFLMKASQWDAHPALTEEVSPTRVLLVDDNADMRAYVQRLLGAHWTVEAVANGTEALAAIRERTPDLVVCDVMMPGLDGFGFLHELRAHPLTASIPVILLSARAGEEAAIEGLRAGANDYLVKPFSARELVSRVRAQLELSRAHTEARVRLHAQLMQAPVPVAIFSGPDLVLELANPRYLEMVGRQPCVVGRPVRAVYPELPHDAPVFRLLEEVYASGRAFTADDYRIPFDRRGDGVTEDVYFQITCQPMRDALGTVVGIMVVATDVTAQILARTQAQEADRRKDEFLAMLAHELRNPLAALSTALEVMKLTRGDEARETRLRELCKHQVECLVRMVDDLLDVSRITRGTVELRKQEVDLCSSVQNVLETLRPQLDGRRHELSVTFGPGGFRLEADATRLEQVISNLLSNAIKYTEPGGHIAIRLGREEVEGHPWAVLRVRDSGRGIPRDMLEKVFELFVQVDASIDRSAGGLGIGLTLVKRLVGLHGGTVHAHSEGPGQGSEFVVRLPLSPEAPRAIRTARPLPRQAPALQPKRRVLVVEDRAAVRETLRVLLQGLGHEVEVATQGLEGVSKALELLPDVTLVDVGLPGIDGHELARRVRASRDGGSLFLVALTGYGGPEAQAKALEAGFDLHFVKPLRESDLLQVLEGARRIAARGESHSEPPGSHGTDTLTWSQEGT